MENQFQKLSIFVSRQADRMTGTPAKRCGAAAGFSGQMMEAQKLSWEPQFAIRQLLDYNNSRPRYGGAEKLIQD
jgi:hypothetical protein